MSAPSMKILCRYQYDPLDRLVGLKPLENPGTQRFYQKDELVNEIEGQSQLTIMRHGPQPLAQRSGTDAAAETMLLATDQQCSLLRTVADTDSRQMAYTAYGYRTGESGLSCLLGFNGERPDSITGHYLLGQGNRAFNPVLMRFNSPDELSPFGEGGINVYAYCGNDPVNRYDPSGNVAIVQPWRSPPIQKNYPLTVVLGKKLNSLDSKSITIFQAARSALPAPWKTKPQFYGANKSTYSALPAEPAHSLYTRDSPPGTLTNATDKINTLINRAALYDEVIKEHPFMTRLVNTPRRQAYNAAERNLNKLNTNGASAEQIERATAELTLARWNAKNGDIIQYLEVSVWNIRTNPDTTPNPVNNRARSR
ncbi:RHS repeat-associated core domain-containing protein [Pseudomonas sp. NFACC23-1]|uniref:RHS repeat-associated core domain-containing protein n=1 Tax=unclassified Pseudomonas TaxID=196821 RepID=UPI000890CCE6|nr:MULTISPECIES: RHS repeat-associated core domain-containing protein [unclassified Pseudomonas]SDB14490.1 RHS repeat-associated core domain-containing protein [Pseudomonas sp. NFACC17-2]SEJ12056.1 RHS repeat-associated core domain-containing protein [Pseudomonas sp. NFACC23-1]SFW47889.1 RHS repeat-associated core domain-containing protein [Pseudomonas sp. NFACC16-2]